MWQYLFASDDQTKEDLVKVRDVTGYTFAHLLREGAKAISQPYFFNQIFPVMSGKLENSKGE